MTRVVNDWQDFFNTVEFSKTGTAHLFRNPRVSKIDTIDNEEIVTSIHYKYTLYPSSPDYGSVFDQQPIAQGFTAFADGCALVGIFSARKLLERGERPNTVEMFKEYREKALIPGRDNNAKEIRPKTGVALDFQLYTDHHSAEKENLQLSQKYYSDCADDTDRSIKLQIKEYADEYLLWLQAEIKKISDYESLNTKSKKEQVREILKPSFVNSGEPQFDLLIEHITATTRPTTVTKLVHDGTKDNLYKALKKLIRLGYERRHIATVLSELVNVGYEAVYKHI